MGWICVMVVTFIIATAIVICKFLEHKERINRQELAMYIKTEISKQIEERQSLNSSNGKNERF